MKNIKFLLILCLFQIDLKSQIIKYDFNTYHGAEIKQGVLFSKESYKKFYNSIKTKDSLISEYTVKDSLQNLKIQKLNIVILNKDFIIRNDSTNIKNLEVIYNKADSLYQERRTAYTNLDKKYVRAKTATKYVAVISFLVGVLVGFKIF